MAETTFLLDLDNTLLANDMQVFLPAYFATLSRRLSRFTSDEDLLLLTRRAIQIMLANEDPTVTNYTAFMAEFARQLGQPSGIVEPLLDIFYREDYPQLQAYTSRRPEARPVVSLLFERGFKVVIATNPFFPTPAIEQRLAWAAVDDFPFALVTTMDNSHFAKPDPRYYREILNQVGSTPAESWMVGDDLYRDIIPAQTLGLKTWWITDFVAPTEPQPDAPANQQGSLSDFLTWLQNITTGD